MSALPDTLFSVLEARGKTKRRTSTNNCPKRVCRSARTNPVGSHSRFGETFSMILCGGGCLWGARGLKIKNKCVFFYSNSMIYDENKDLCCLISGEDLPAEEKHPVLQRPSRKKTCLASRYVFHWISGEDARQSRKIWFASDPEPARTKKAGVPPCVSMDFGGGSAGKKTGHWRGGT